MSREQRLDAKLARDEFRERAAEFLKLSAGGMELHEAARATDIQVRTARMLLGRPDMRERLAEQERSAPEPVKRESISVRELEAALPADAYRLTPAERSMTPDDRAIAAFSHHESYPHPFDDPERERNRSVANRIWAAHVTGVGRDPPRPQRRPRRSLRRA